MIDITINLTIDQDHEEYFEQIMKHISTVPGISKVDIKTDTYHEYNIDSTPHWEVDFEEITPEEFTERADYWENNEYHGIDYFITEIDVDCYLACDNSSAEFFTEEFKTKEEAVEWLNGEENK